ncbi:LptE family protein [Trichlorobacter ammonificans]|uniref:Lipopolysaccharide-assembly n=1 Tax=Trichlorobacter ammonificans TaxID=2916410 RepID=A0ABM9D7K0_9BACT|nr:LptE family protein [Trichlorobacter ammonificans]CAH2031182.1 Lipopolysaccharide-assembly [Trichlorobacter ammonificans]
MLLLTLVAGCGYRFTADQGARLAAGSTVWVPFFRNTTVYPLGSVALKRALFEQFAAQRGIMAASSPETADLLLEGTLIGYQSTAVSYTAADTAREYRLTINAEITVRRRGDAAGTPPFWKGSLTAWQEYPASSSLEQQRRSEDAALEAAARKLAQQAIWQMEQQY